MSASIPCKWFYCYTLSIISEWVWIFDKYFLLDKNHENICEPEVVSQKTATYLNVMLKHYNNAVTY
jgi:hypothetical protein